MWGIPIIGSENLILNRQDPKVAKKDLFEPPRCQERQARLVSLAVPRVAGRRRRKGGSGRLPLMSDHRLYLASNSPRRRALLEQIGISYRVLPVAVDESARPGEPAEELAARLALDKARAGRAGLPSGDARPVLGADTLVVCDGHSVGKPRDRDEALAMLTALSGRSHEVLSAVALIDRSEERVALSCSRVSFRRISRAEAVAYWASGEPADKAGGYAIQGLGAVFVADLTGSYSGVMGLPLFETAQLLHEFGIETLENGKHEEPDRRT